MNTESPSAIAIDVETIALPLEQWMIDAISARFDNDEDAAEEVGRAALYPYAARVLCVGMENPETRLGTCIMNDSEAEVLRELWDKIAKYKRVITFNGRGFDIPILVARSVVHSITPSRKDLMGQRFAAMPHCDLLDQFSFYGATRKCTLDVYCRMWGIASPKRHGVDGSMVEQLYKAGKLDEVKTYNMDDVRANCELFNVWKKYYDRGW